MSLFLYNISCPSLSKIENILFNVRKETPRKRLKERKNKQEWIDSKAYIHTSKNSLCNRLLQRSVQLCNCLWRREKKFYISVFCLLKYHDPLQYWEQFRERAGENEGRKSTLWYWAVNYVYINRGATNRFNYLRKNYRCIDIRVLPISRRDLKKIGRGRQIVTDVPLVFHWLIADQQRLVVFFFCKVNKCCRCDCLFKRCANTNFSSLEVHRFFWTSSPIRFKIFSFP